MKLSGQKWSQSLTAVYEGWSFMIGSCYRALSGKIQVLWIGGYGRCVGDLAVKLQPLKAGNLKSNRLP